MRSYCKYTKEMLEPIVKNSRSFRNVVINLGKFPHGGLIAHIKKKIERFGIQHDHFKKGGWSKGMTFTNRRKSSADIFSGGRESCRAYLTRRALLETGRKYVCGICGMGPTWNGKELVFEIDHVDGDRGNNNPDNLRFVCPNCHSQTDTYKTKNRKIGRVDYGTRLESERR